MKKTYAGLLLRCASAIIIQSVFFSSQSNAQAYWQWASGSGGSSTDIAAGIAASSNGNVYTTGSFYSDTITFGSTHLANSGVGDIFIAGYDASGSAMWALAAGSSNEDNGNGIAIDSSGNIYVTGSFSSAAITMGSSVLTNYNPVNGTADVFLAKLDAAGNVLWTTSAGGDTTDRAFSIACDAAGNIYITGEFTSPSIAFGSVVLTNNNNSNFFIAKYDSAGNVLWAHNNDLGFCWGMSIAADVAGNAYVLGNLSDSTMVFGGTTLHNMDGLGWTPDLFIAKYDMNGNVQWAEDIGGTDYDGDGDIAADPWGNVFICGYYFSNTINIGSFVLTNSSSGGDDYFTAKFDAGGNALWARDANGYCEPYAIAADRYGNCYVTGEFEVSVSFGADTIYADTTFGPYGDVFVVRYDANGNPSWQTSGGGTNYEEAWAITADADRNVFIAGDFASDTVYFGSNVLFNDTSDHSTDLFAARIYGSCAAGFMLYPDTSQLHHYIAINTSSGMEPFISYTWYWGDGATDTGAYPTHVYADSGFYDICLVIMDSIGCTSTFCDSSFHALHSNNSMVYISVVPSFPTGVKKTEMNFEEMNVHPNPASEILSLSCSSFISGEKVHLIFHNVLGEIIFEKELAWTEKNQINIAGLPSGVYMITASGRNAIVNSKLVKE